MTRNDLFVIRDFKPEDVNFIYASWLRGLYYGESWFSLINKDKFMNHYHKVINFILNDKPTKVKIACLKEDNDVILGYAVVAPETLHWVFVKKSFRGIGIAKDLVPNDIKTVTHLTKTGLSIMRKKHDIEFNPFIT